ncbi:type II CRISPR RNA-guided endonuclease Cas9 [Corynebacterium sp. HS2168-gen11]|uniref:type II CRISPR RNA-guided endonuclease Cas9 n=1 Tax=Corynebacterium sp. HS2168-gen11 TaxID=2974027 RepID=UPI00216B184C|nr:type II CRISPR RNA-guided endonuclease Cas9 [Corynebacterium sp. HS2168-gen11]MCS4535312.1 HNH endonuclease [Corynebacterium sp. HS2168-gen11]
MATTRYRVGIDVGSFSVGTTALEIDADGMPIKILSSVSHIHDSGLDPDQIKSAVTRLASSGVARRTRRLYRRKRRRLQKLDAFLEQQGWPVTPFEDYEDPFYPWRVRTELISSPIEDQAELGEKLSIALRHIARHRGWRNPYMKVNTLHVPAAPSAGFEQIREESTKLIGRPFPETVSLAQIVTAVALGKQKLRGEQGLLSARLMQSDFANEIQAIAKMQGLTSELTNTLIDYVFAAESPKGSAASRTGKDPLQPQRYRALKATDAFQKYRVAALIGNLRIREGNAKVALTQEQFMLVYNHLIELPVTKEPSWIAIAEVLGIDRGHLLGTATMTDDGERAGAKPPTHDTNRRILGCKIKPLVQWWKQASAAEQDAMIKALSNAEVDDFDSEVGAKVQAFFADLSDDDHAKLDALYLPIGRAAYSEDTLRRLTRRMLEEGVDLYTARRAEFNIEPDWAPPAPPIGEPVGNPAVDRVLKTVARWLQAAEDTWGAPESVNIEHVRASFMSEAQVRQIDRDNQNRAKRNLALVEQMQQQLNIEGRPRSADLWRYQSIQRQNGQCAYCGSPINFTNSEMDHIVPRAGEGSTNTRENLIAACKRCNSEKSNIPFAVWAKQCQRPGVSVAEAIERTRHWLVDPGMRTKDFNKFRQAVIDRFRRTTMDEEIDNRSIESVAWMANELRARISQNFHNTDTKVRVFKGSLTAEARKASGISGKLEFIDGVGKSRLDRRHHAVDAAVIAMMSAYVAETLAVRSNLKHDQELRRLAPQWKEYTGKDAAHRSEWKNWIKRMHALVALLNDAMEQDRIVVSSNLRLRLGNGRVHEETIGALKYLRVGDAISVTDIDRASSEALWCALTRDPDFDPKEGLPANPDRVIRIHDKRLYADDRIGFFPVGAGCLAVNGGYVELGASFHHARIYRITSGKKPAYAMLRVYGIDLVKHRHEDLFTAEIAPQTMSVRQCEPKLRKALADGTAEYLGWFVQDDELLVDMTAFTDGQVGGMQAELGEVRRWKVDGFYNPRQLRLRPRLLSAEGLPKNASENLKKVIDAPGWLPAVNKLFTFGKVVVIRRDILGRPRLESNAHLPITWEVK